MSDARPPSGPSEPEHGSDDPRPDEDDAPAWRSFGVPHGGAPEPSPYTPAMRERPRADLTQPIDTSSTTWSTPSAGGSAPAAPAGPEAHGGPRPPESRGWWSTPDPSGATTPAPVSRPGQDNAPYPSLPAPSGEPHPGLPLPPPSAPSTPLWASAPTPPTTPTWTTGGAGPGAPWMTPPAGGPPTTPVPTDRAPAPQGRRRFAALGALALVAALLGGGVALAGQQLLTRGATLGTAVPAPGPGSTARPDGSIAKIAADALPSVVTVRIKTSQGNGTGSGFVIDKQGHILTNNHVVAAAAGASDIAVELNNGKTLPVTVAGADASYDLAVLKVDATDLAPLEFGASKDVVVGDGVIAVGAPLGLDATVTSGIVSALNRPVSPGDANDQSFINAIQTDAAINPGNSGGPLLDMNGRVIGVNSAIARIPGSTSDSGGNIGVGFAIPSDQAAKTAQQLITQGKADHPALGVRVDRSFTGDGAKVAAGGIQSGSAAEKAGIQDGDVIVEFEGKKVTDADSLIVAVRAHSVGDTVRLKIQRGNQTVDLSMTLQSATS